MRDPCNDGFAAIGRRRFLACAAAAVAAFDVGAADTPDAKIRGAEGAKTASRPIALPRGPHLLIDDYLIDSVQGVARKVNQPKRHLAGPVVPSTEGYRNCQPWCTVLRDPVTGKFRMWYNAHPGVEYPDNVYEGLYATHFATLASDDGETWKAPYVWTKLPLSFDATVLDDGPSCAKPAERYKLAYLCATTRKSNNLQTRVAFSPDGLQWTSAGDVFPGDTDDDIGDFEHTFVLDPGKRYGMFLRTNRRTPYRWTNREGRVLEMPCRVIGLSTSPDFRRWSPPRTAFAPDDKDPGVTQYYGMSAIQRRGELFVGLLLVLRDDLSASGVGDEAKQKNAQTYARYKVPIGAGIGYTMLAWSRDGTNWTRDRAASYTIDHFEPAKDDNVFFGPNPKEGAWDHAHAWITSAVPVGDEVYLYYGGYALGHKVFSDRQIGMLKMRRDRYVARESGSREGTLTTKPLMLDAAKITLNADAAQGSVKVQLLDAGGKPIPGFTAADGGEVTADALAAEVRWKRNLAELKSRPLRIQFILKDARLFAFSLE